MFRELKQTILSTLVMVLLNVATAGASEQGMYWKMKSPSGKVSYLFGTIHTDDNRVTDFSPPILEALKSVDLFVMETTPNSDPANYAMKDASLSSILSDKEIDQVKKLADFHVMHLEQALQMKPWLLAMVFSQAKPQTPFAQDNLLMRAAEDFGQPVKGLETSEEHFGVVDGFNMDEQLVLLRAALKMTDAQKERDFERLITVYLEGNEERLLKVNSEITRANLPKKIAQKMLVKLLDERNVLMATRAIKLTKNQTAFIAVGASHLAGKNGFISAFKNAGYQLRPIHK